MNILGLISQLIGIKTLRLTESIASLNVQRVARIPIMVIIVSDKIYV